MKWAGPYLNTAILVEIDDFLELRLDLKRLGATGPAPQIIRDAMGILAVLIQRRGHDPDDDMYDEDDGGEEGGDHAGAVGVLDAAPAVRKHDD